MILGHFHKILSNMIPISVEENYAMGRLVSEKTIQGGKNLIMALMLGNLQEVMVYTPGCSTILRLPNGAKSKHKFCSVSEVG
jgi:hypothetical protein